MLCKFSALNLSRAFLKRIQRSYIALCGIDHAVYLYKTIAVNLSSIKQYSASDANIS